MDDPFEAMDHDDRGARDDDFFDEEIDEEDDSDEERSASSDEESSIDVEERFNTNLRRIKENDPRATDLEGSGEDEAIQNMTDEEWEELGSYIAANNYLGVVELSLGALNDHKISYLFRGLTRSNTIKEMLLYDNGLSVDGLRSMLPFLQNSNNLRYLHLYGNNIQSEGFNLLFRTLSDSPIEKLRCVNCDIESIEIDGNEIPKYLKTIILDDNNINADGCREVAKLLQGGDSTLTTLWLGNNKIDDEGVTILVDALQNNTKLTTLDLRENDGLSTQGQIMLLKLVNDISSIKALCNQITH